MDITRLTGVSRSEDIRQEDFGQVVEFLDRQVRSLAKSSKPGVDPGAIRQDRPEG
jgi:hypothetical protein